MNDLHDGDRLVSVLSPLPIHERPVYRVTGVGVLHVLISRTLPTGEVDELVLTKYNVVNEFMPALPQGQYVVLFPGGKWTWRTDEQNAIKLANETGGTYVGNCIPVPMSEVKTNIHYSAVQDASVSADANLAVMTA